jgi:hypothetical protein
MKIRITSAIMVVLVSTLLVSCTNRILDFTVVSSKNLDLTKGASFVKGKSRVTGEDLAHWIIVIPTSEVNIKEALDRAIESTPGCVALLDGVIYEKFWYFPYVYGQQVVIVEGTPLIDPSLTILEKAYPTYGVIELSKDGEVLHVTETTESEFNKRKFKFTK